MTTEAMKIKVAEMLKTTTEKLNARVFGLKLGDVCDRCGGCGEYSFNPTHGTKCFKCDGSGQTISNSLAGWKRIYNRAIQVKPYEIEAYLQDLRNRKNASGAFKTLHTAWKSANERIGMPKHFTLNSPQHSAFNAAIAPFSEKLSTLQYKKDSHNEVLAVLKEGLETIAKKEIELFGS